jgi:hypothetical protein
MAELTQEEVLGILNRKGIDKVTVKFSGGHDSGGTDGITVDLFGEEVEWSQKELDTIKEGLYDALEAPVWDRYGTFCGEYHVDGEVIWDVKAKKVFLKGYQEVSVTESFEEELE